MRLREVSYLVVARTTMADCVPIFWTRHRDQAVGKAGNVRSGFANDAAHRLKLPLGKIISVYVVELVNGSPARMEEMTYREAVDIEIDNAARAVERPRKSMATQFADVEELPE